MQQNEERHYGTSDYSVDLDDIFTRIETNIAGGVEPGRILRWAWSTLDAAIPDGVRWKLPDGTRATSEQFRRAVYGQCCRLTAYYERYPPTAERVEQLRMKL